MTASSDTLAAFLGARLDEDEAGIRAFALREDGVRVPVTHFRGKPLAERMLREVEAKRAILASAEAAEKYARQFSGDPVGIGQAAALDGVLRHFAAVYADHPGYQPYWKP